MIPFKNRFHGPNAVRRLKGPSVHTQHFSARVRKNPRASTYKLAVVVSKKVAPKAVARNRIRRRVFEQIRTQARMNGLPIEMIIYLKSPDIAVLPAEIIAQELSELTRKAIARVL